MTAMMLAGSNLNLEVVKLLVAFEIGRQNNDGLTALMLTAKQNITGIYRNIMKYQQPIIQLLMAEVGYRNK